MHAIRHAKPFKKQGVAVHFYTNTALVSSMKILVFLHGTTIMHKTRTTCSRKKRVRQSMKREKAVLDYASYVPIGNAVEKLREWKRQGAGVLYLSSHKHANDVAKDKAVLGKYHFPSGRVFYRGKGETYAAIAERILPDVLIEDDCESIGGKKEMTSTHIKPMLKRKIKCIVVKEFGGIDRLPDNVSDLLQVHF